MVSVLQVGFVVGGVLGDDSTAGPGFRDSLVEWTAERYILSGGAMDTPMPDMAEAVGTAEFIGKRPLEGDAPILHARTPAGIVVNSWMALIPRGRVLAVTIFVVGIALGLILVLSEQVVGRAVPLPAIPLMVWTPPVVQMVWHRSTGWLVAISVLAGWYLVVRGKPVAAGLAIVPGICLRLWPLVFVPFLILRGQWRAALSATIGTVALNCVGLLLPGVSLEGSLATLATQNSALDWPANLSVVGTAVRGGLPAPLGYAATVGLLTAAYLYTRRKPLRLGFGWVLLAAMVASPLIWPHYRVVLLPLALGHPIGWAVLAVEMAQQVRLFASWGANHLVEHGLYGWITAGLLAVCWRLADGRHLSKDEEGPHHVRIRTCVRLDAELHSRRSRP